MKKNTILALASLFLLSACASMGTPDGGPYDEEPPVLLEAYPALNSVNVTEARVQLVFDENVRLENAFEKVVVSPPQLEMPEIKYSGRKVTVELRDSLIPNTTYSIDFSDAIVDNNEGNPYENFAYVFSTGESVDTFAVSGTVLNARDLEPVKGIVVGIHSNLDDSAFTTTPFERVSRTDSRGRFTIKGIAPGTYRVYALKDANQNFYFDQKSEALGFIDTHIVPFATEAVRPDTVWRDSVTVDTVRYVKYTRFQPDDIILRAFEEELYSQYLVKSPRDDHKKFTLFFAAHNEVLPTVEGLDFDFEGKYLLESNETKDTLAYWLKDSTFYRADTLAFKVTYMVPDSLGVLVDRCDTLYLSPKRRWEKVVEQANKKLADEEADFMKRARRAEGYDENNPPLFVPPTPVLPVRFAGGANADVDGSFKFSFDEPLQSIDTSAIRLTVLVDSVYVPAEFVIRQNPLKIREYEVFAEWRPEQKYRIVADSAAFKGIYGGISDAFSQDMTFRSFDDYAVLHLDIPSVSNNAIVELLDKQERVVKSLISNDGRCSFYFIRPGTYYLRLTLDGNGNGKWDTGDFESGLQPEQVYYYPHSLDLRPMFEYTQDDWDIYAPLETQKPLDITKQKPDREHKKRNRNATRKFR